MLFDSSQCCWACILKRIQTPETLANFRVFPCFPCHLPHRSGRCNRQGRASFPQDMMHQTHSSKLSWCFQSNHHHSKSLFQGSSKGNTTSLPLSNKGRCHLENCTRNQNNKQRNTSM